MMSNADLRPCPFCGGAAKVKTGYSEKNNAYYSEISCTSCLARSKVKRTETEPTEQQIYDLIARWNIRA